MARRRLTLPRLILWICPVVSLLTACGSSVDLYETTAAERPLAAWTTPPPIATLSLRIGADERSLAERGLRRPGGTSYLGTSRLTEPVEVSLLRILGREAVRQGVAERAIFRSDSSAYVAEIDIRELSASFSEGVENLTVILPTSRIAARVEGTIRLLDPVGRRLGEVPLMAEEASMSSAIQDAEEAAAETLARALQAGIDAAWPAVDRILRADRAQRL